MGTDTPETHLPELTDMLINRLVPTVVAAAVFAFGIGATAQAGMPFGSQGDVDYAAVLWKSLEANRLAGKGAIATTPYEGMAPHGAILETIETTIGVKGHIGTAIVKRNYGPENIEKEQVANEGAKHLKAVTVMFRRAQGYDPENNNWFWVKYAPNGIVLKNPKGVPLAGMVGKGMDAGCIACHKAAPGGDSVFNHDRYAKKM